MDASGGNQSGGGGRAGELFPRRVVVAHGEIDAIAAIVAELCAAEPHVVLAFIHGSAVAGKPAADLDIGIFFDEAVGSNAKLAFDVCETIASRLERSGVVTLPLDVRPVNGSGPAFRFQLLSNGRLVYFRSRDEKVIAAAEWASEWHDFKPFHDRQVEAILRKEKA